jgi:hypothetical protein
MKTMVWHISWSCMPHHRLHVKNGAVYRLLQNFLIDRGLVKKRLRRRHWPRIKAYHNSNPKTEQPNAIR